MSRFDLRKSCLLLLVFLWIHIASTAHEYPPTLEQDNSIDLSLTLTTDTPDIQQWQRGDFTLVLENTGELTATNIAVSLPLASSDVIIVGGTRPNAELGQYTNGVWQGIDLAAGEDVTLTLTLFNKSPNLQLFAQVIAADQEDLDSTPNNGSCCTSNEDDEATFPNNGTNGGGGTAFDLANLEILSHTCPNEFPQPSGTLNFDVTIRNNGTITSPNLPLRLFKITNGRRGSFIPALYSASDIPSISAGETQTVSVSYSIPFENEIQVPGTLLSVDFTVGTDVLTFLDEPSITERGYPIDLYCQKNNADLAVKINREANNYSDDGLINYTVEVSNLGNETIHNITVIYARTGFGNGRIIATDISSEQSVFTGNIGGVLPALEYWYIPALSANAKTTIAVQYELFPIDDSGTPPTVYDINASASSPHLIDENEENNTASVTFRATIDASQAIDLELSLATNTPNILRWQKATYTLTLENKGMSDATGVVVSMPLNGNEATIVGGTRPLASAGTYRNPFWSDLTVAAGESVTLELQLFSKVDDLQLFAQVTAADQADIDSAPNNGLCCVLEEDDEATLLPDLTLSNVQFPSEIERGEDVRFTLDVDNIGAATARGEFILGFYLSTDETLEEGDRFIGIIRTADLTVDKHQANALINIARDVLPGDYYLLAVIDVDGEVQESDESNNVYSSPVAVGRGGNIDLQLRFSSPSEEVNTFVALPLTLIITNTGEGDATGVIVNFPLEAGKVVLAGGNVPTFTRGNYNYFNGMWYVNDLPAGESAILTIELFPIGEDYTPFAQVIAANQDDIDSTPDNGVCCIIMEDDEATFPANTIVGERVDIEVSLSTPNTNVGRFANFPVSVEIANTGTVEAKDVLVQLESCGLADTRLFVNASGIVHSNQPPIASLGTYNRIQQLWQIGNLAAGERATLDVNLYSLTNEQVRVRAVGIYTGNDIDSSPNFFDFEGCDAIEDDEAVIDINIGGGNLNNQPIFQTVTSNDDALYVYPNPSTDWLNVAFYSQITQVNYSIFDTQGKQCKQGIWETTKGFHSNSINIANLPKGIYLLQIHQAEAQEMIRFSKF